MQQASAFPSALAGLGFGLSLIVAIGAQNAFVLRQGLRGEHVWLVVAIAAISDVLLIAAGVAGVGAVIEAAPALATAMRIAGAAFLLAYAALAARRAVHPGVLEPLEAEAAGPSRRAVAGAILALTWLNPHVYLDTVVLLGSVASSHDADRWAFGVGAATGSVLWFSALGWGSAALRPLFARPGAWRVLDGLVAAVMVVIAITLLAGL